MRILLVEDDREAARYIVKGLGEAGHTCDHACGDTCGDGHACSGAPHIGRCGNDGPDGRNLTGMPCIR